MYLNSSNDKSSTDVGKKRNLTFNLETKFDETDSAKQQQHSNCYHHYIDEPTKVVELVIE
jgi:hypothetical protein